MKKMSKKDMDKIPMRNKDIKKLTEKQQKIARKAHPYDEITGADFKVLREEKNA
ncbi:MAG: hypothetical protein GOVbin1629_55 [Prokaryotic dsDNA virus sp.]|nr:MAG: hypothetical protein GOVbin1629_55 [Prokaryotic dsDNA virus sp.]|tara:strand:- start:130 stop:291 length:162 start_codon:yes stop_codon:yes gene_type:complete